MGEEREAEEDKHIVGEERGRGSDTGKCMKSSFMYLQCLFQQVCLCSSLVNTKANYFKCHEGFFQCLRTHSVYGGFAIEMCFASLNI